MRCECEIDGTVSPMSGCYLRRREPNHRNSWWTIEHLKNIKAETF